MKLLAPLVLLLLLAPSTQAAPACHPDSKKLSWHVCVLDAPLAEASRCVSSRKLATKSCDLGDLAQHLQGNEQGQPVVFYALSGRHFGGVWGFQSDTPKPGCDIRVGALSPSFLATEQERAQASDPAALNEVVRYRLEKQKQRLFTSISPTAVNPTHCAGTAIQAEVTDKTATPRALYRAKANF